MSDFGPKRSGGIAMPQLQRWMRSHAKRNRTRKENIRALLLGSFLASVFFGLTTYWVGLNVEERRADMADQFSFIKAAVLAHVMSGVMEENGTPLLPCPDLTGDGRAAISCGASELDGYVPWFTLGIDQEATINDWGLPVIYKIDRPNAHTCAGRLPRRGNLIFTRQFEGEELSRVLNAVFILQSYKPKARGKSGLNFVDAGTSGLFLGLCQNSEIMRTVQF
ncbi:MAG: hypothetical protein HOO09_03240 [Rhodospirillaceae bacterium]|mgnify:CR=1 FL=1|nr:hypothetical protein [Rhodospirillaceae bacterium]MBT5566670.1 hypothetical protein [Rhodospirillaceae bacterium]